MLPVQLVEDSILRLSPRLARQLTTCTQGGFYSASGRERQSTKCRFFPGGWPNWDERIARLDESITLMRQMWTEDEYFDFHGKYFAMNENLPLHSTKVQHSDLLFGSWTKSGFSRWDLRRSLGDYWYSKTVHRCDFSSIRRRSEKVWKIFQKTARRWFCSMFTSDRRRKA